MEQKAAIVFCLTLKKTAIETLKMLKSAYGEECLSRKICFNGIAFQRRAGVIKK
jgi:hypothetical protein